MSTEKTYIPPIKIQGIKTKITPLIKANVRFQENSLWLEPFMGSGVVGFNVVPKNAIFSDINPHLITFYNAIKSKEITSRKARLFLEREGKLLEASGQDYFYAVRERFNISHEPLDFLFLNRSCFNGMIRFNKNRQFNVPFGHKPQRFSKAYITKIVHQIEYVAQQIEQNDWHFVLQPFEESIKQAPANAFIYCDPPYIGRHVDYYDSWDETQEIRLKTALIESSCRFMISTWEHNRYRTNDYIAKLWKFCYKITTEHFYFVGGKITNRNSMTEALLMNYQPETLPNILDTTVSLPLFDSLSE